MNRNNFKRYEEVKNLIPKNELINLLQTKTYRTIGKEYECSERLISKLAQEYDIPKNQKIIYERETISKSFDLNHILYLYFDKYKSCREIAEIYHTTHATISKYLRRNNIDIRPGFDLNYYKSRRKFQPTAFKDCNGYVVLIINGIRIREHRYVMEKYIGRKLNDYEHVHHINFIRDDNRIENLFLFSSGSKHKFYHSYINSHRYISPQEYLNKFEDLIDEVIDYDFLYNLYINKNCSANYISQYILEQYNFEITRETIVNYLKEYGIFDMRSPNIN